MADAKFVKAAQSGKTARTAPAKAGDGRDTMPKGDGLKTSWGMEKGKRIDVPAAKKKVR